MRAILIDPFACEARHVHLSEDPDEWKRLADWYAILSHETMSVNALDHVVLPGRNVLIVDEYGLVRHPPVQRWFRLIGLHHEMLAGKGLLVGARPDGVEREPSIRIDTVRASVVYFELIGIGGYMRETVRPWKE